MNMIISRMWMQCVVVDGEDIQAENLSPVIINGYSCTARNVFILSSNWNSIFPFIIDDIKE